MKRTTQHPAIFFAHAASSAALAATLAACAPAPPRSTSPPVRVPAPAAAPGPAQQAPAGAPPIFAGALVPYGPPLPDTYRRELAAGHHVLAIDSAQSLIVATVRSGGPFARFGHDHAIAAHRITGYVAPTANQADFSFRLDELQVDEPAQRTAAGLSTRQPDASAIAGTRHNMLGPVLQAADYPTVNLHAELVTPSQARLTINLHGRTQTLTVPARSRGGNLMTIEGEFSIRQTDFGIQPYSVLGGALAVQDSIALRYRLVAYDVND